MAAKIVGGCMCGAVRYESATDAVMQASCYCRDCQRSTGSAFAPVLLVPKEAFKLTKGELKHYEVTGDSGNKVSRAASTIRISFSPRRASSSPARRAGRRIFRACRPSRAIPVDTALIVFRIGSSRSLQNLKKIAVVVGP